MPGTLSGIFIEVGANFAFRAEISQAARSKGFPVKAFASTTAPDSFVYRGFFNAVFEQKEYGKGYVLEKLAREMLAKDANLKKGFEAKLKDETFAKNPRAGLNFFYERSPYFLNQHVGFYRVGCIVEKLNGNIFG